MSKPEDVRVEYSLEVLVNTGNFENVKPGYKVSASVPSDTHPNEVRTKLKNLVEAWLTEEIAEIHADMEARKQGN